MRMRLVWVLPLVLLFACASKTSQLRDAGPDQTSSGSQSVPANWDNPIDGDPVNSFDDGRSDVGFSARQPQNLGDPKSIFVTRLSGSQRQDRVLAFVFDTASYGRVVVIEEPLRITAAEWLKSIQANAASNGSSGTSGRADVVTIKGGVQAEITTSGDLAHSDIRWIEGTMQILVRGPTLNHDECLELGNKV